VRFDNPQVEVILVHIIKGPLTNASNNLMTQKLASLVDESCDEAKRQFTCRLVCSMGSPFDNFFSNNIIFC